MASKQTKVQIDLELDGLRENLKQLQRLATASGEFGTISKKSAKELDQLIGRMSKGTEFTKKQIETFAGELKRISRDISGEISKFGSDPRGIEELEKALHKMQSSLGGLSTAFKKAQKAQDDFKKSQEKLAKTNLETSDIFKVAKAGSKKKDFDSVYQALEQTAQQSPAFIRTLDISEDEKARRIGETDAARRALSTYKEKLEETRREEKEYAKAIKEASDKLEAQREEYEKLKSTLEFKKTTSPVIQEGLGDVSKGLGDIGQDIGDRASVIPVGGTAAVKTVGKIDGAFSKAAKTLFRYQIVMGALKKVTKEAISTIYEMDKALTEMTVATGLSRKEAAKYTAEIQKISKATSTAMTEVARLTTEYTKQGRSIKESLKLAEATARAAKISSLSTSDALQYMTTAIKGFGLSADTAVKVSDTWAVLGTTAATKFDAVAIALSKVAAQANSANMSFEFTSSILAKMLETTQEAPESIGTALKTVIARMRELSDYGKTLEEGIDVNQVERALGAVGIKLRDVNNQFRSMEDIFNEVGMAWETFSGTQQQAIAQAMAGSRQQSRLLSIFQDYGRTLELADEAQRSAGASMFQYSQYAKGMEAQITKMKTSWQSFTQALVESKAVITAIDAVATVLDGLAAGLKAAGALGPMILATAALLLFFTAQRAKVEQQILAYKTANVPLENASLLFKMKSWLFGKAETAEKKKQLIAEGKLTAAKWAGVTPVLIQLGLYLLIAAAVVGIVLLIAAMIKGYESIASINKKIQETQAKIYELQKDQRALEKNIDSYEEILNRATKTREELEKMREIEDEIADKYKIRLTGQALLTFLAEQEAKAHADIAKEQEKSLKLTQKLARKGGAFSNEALAAYSTQAYLTRTSLIGQRSFSSEDERMAYSQKVAAYNIDFKGIFERHGRDTVAATAAIDQATKDVENYVWAMVDFEGTTAQAFNEYLKLVGQSSQDGKQAIEEGNILFATFARLYGGEGGAMLAGLEGMDINTDLIGAFLEKARKLSTVDNPIEDMFQDIFAQGGTKNELYKAALERIESLNLSDAEKRSLSTAIGAAIGNIGLLESIDTSVKVVSSVAKTEELIAKMDKDGLSIEDVKEMQGLNIEMGATEEETRENLINKVKELKQLERERIAEQIKAKEIDLEMAKTDDERAQIQSEINYLKQSALALDDKSLRLKKEELQLNAKIAAYQSKYLSDAERLLIAEDIYKEGIKAYKDLEDEVEKRYGKGNYSLIGGKLTVFTEGAEVQKDAAEHQTQLDNIFKEQVEGPQEYILEVLKKRLDEEQEAIKKSLDTRRKYYDKYYDALEAQEKKEDLDAKRSRLMTAITKLSTSGDAQSLQRLREYQQQLKEIENEQRQGERELRREAVQEQFESLEQAISDAYEETKKNIENVWVGFWDKGIEGFADFLENVTFEVELSNLGDLANIRPTIEARSGVSASITPIEGGGTTTTLNIDGITVNISGDVSEADGYKIARSVWDGLTEIVYANGIPVDVNPGAR